MRGRGVIMPHLSWVPTKVMMMDKALECYEGKRWVKFGGEYFQNTLTLGS